MKIEVTQDDIARGRPNNCGYCPVALALNRHMGVSNWLVFRENCSGSLDDMLIICDLPREARQFIEAFDDGKPVHPFTFDLDI